MDQDALGTEVGVGPGDIVLDGNPALPHGKGHSRPRLFGSISIVAKQSPSQQLLSSCSVGCATLYKTVDESEINGHAQNKMTLNFATKNYAN